jgi:hypothetical protein
LALKIIFWFIKSINYLNLDEEYYLMANSDITKALEIIASTKETPIIPPEDSRMSVNGDDLIDMKLHAAQEILAEVFGISVNEAEEMIRQRSREKMLWPAGFSVDDK